MHVKLSLGPTIYVGPSESSIFGILFEIMNSAKSYHNDHYYLLRQKAFLDPRNKAARTDLIEFILYLIDWAEALPEEDLLSDEGWLTASDICGVLLTYDLAESKWMRPENEPVLYEIFNLSSPLDVDANNPEAWQKLFAAAGKLK